LKRFAFYITIFTVIILLREEVMETSKNKNKNTYIILAVITAAVILAAVLIFTGGKQKISGTFGVTVNGQEFAPIKSAEYTHNSEKSEKLGFNGKNFKLKGSKDGVYDFCFKVDNTELAEVTGDSRIKNLPQTSEIHFVYICSGKAKKADLDLNAEIYTEGKMLKIRVTADVAHPGSGKSSGVFKEGSEEYNYLYENDIISVDVGL